MKVKAKASGGDYEKPEPGNQAAVLVAVVELGTVEKEFKAETYKTNEILLVWELTGQKGSGGKQPVVGRVYSLSFGTFSNLRKMVEKWFGKAFPDGVEFDLAVLLGRECLLDVQLTKDEKYIKLDPLSVSKLPKGMACEKAERTPVLWEIEGAKGLPEHLDWLPWIYGESACDRIARSGEWKERNAQAAEVRKRVPSTAQPATEAEEDVPF